MSCVCVIRGTAAMLTIFFALGSQPVFAAGPHWQTDFEKAKRQAIAESKPLVAMFTASWCGPCKRMKSSTLIDSAVGELVNSHFIAVMIDTDRSPALTRKFNITGMPTAIILDPVTGETKRAKGYQGRGQFLSFLNANKKELQLASATSPAHAHQPSGSVAIKDKGLLTTYCLANIVNEGKLIEGRPQFSVKRDGLTANFASAKDKAAFLKEPQKYWPQNNGACPVMLSLSRKSVLGEARWAVEYDGKLFFCHSQEHAKKFISTPAKYASQAVAKISGNEYVTSR